MQLHAHYVYAHYVHALDAAAFYGGGMMDRADEGLPADSKGEKVLVEKLATTPEKNHF
jgi:hypothetical protein